MNVGELKELIRSLPDDMPIVECHDGETNVYTIIEVKISVGTVFKFEWDNYNRSLTRISEYSEPLVNSRIIGSYSALIFNTQA